MHWIGLKKDIGARLRHFRHGREAGLQRAVLDDFLLVLAAWGIERVTDIPHVVRDLRLRCLVLTVPLLAALAIALFMPGLYSSLTLILIAPPCLFGLLVTRWRISILRNKAFTPLHRWLAACFVRESHRGVRPLRGAAPLARTQNAFAEWNPEGYVPRDPRDLATLNPERSES
jgi:hypothetical protein